MKKKMIFYILMPLLLVAFTVSTIYAYFTFVIGGDDYGHTLTIGDFIFLMNDKEASDNVVAPEEFTLSRGEAIDFDFVLKVNGSASAGVIKYDFKVNNTNSNETEDEKLMYKAIEVYKTTSTDDHVYISTLYDYLKRDEIGYLGSGDSENFKLTLAYSFGASEIYEGKVLNLTFSATPEITNADTSVPYYFVSNSTQLINAMQAAVTDKKMIVLTSDITFDGVKTSDGSYISFISDGKFGLDLNGHKLLLNKDITVKLARVDEVDFTKGLTDSNPNANSGIISTNGSQFIIDSTDSNDFYPISSGIANNYIDNEIDDDMLCEYVNYLLEEFSSETHFANDTFNLSKGLGYYSNFYTFTTVEDSNFVATAENALIFKNDVSTEFTRKDLFEIIISPNEAAGNKKASTLVTIRGNGLDEVFRYYLAMIPEFIDSSVYLPGYDQATGAKLTWYSSNIDLFSDTGILLPNGMLELDDYTDRNINVGLILELNGDQRITKQCKIEVMSAEQRYYEMQKDSDNQIICDQFSVYDEKTATYTNIINVENYFDLLNANKYGYESIEITVDILDDTTNDYTEDGTQKYLTKISDSEFIVNALPENGQNHKTNIQVTMNFKDNKSFSATKVVILIGQALNTALVDVTPELQNIFSDNPYLTGNDYYFACNSYTSTGAFVDYFVDQTMYPYVEITNGKMVEDPEGKFFIPEGENHYEFIKNKYIKNADGSYSTTASNEGTLYANIDGEYVEIGQTYSRQSYVIINKNKVPPQNVNVVVKAKLYECNNYIEGDANTQIGDDYTLSLPIIGIYHNNSKEIEDANLYYNLLQKFDANKDGYISVTEAQESYTSEFNVSKLTSIKGLEYFTGLTWLKFSEGTFSDLSPIANLYSLEKVHIPNNKNVTNIQALQYLDNLKSIDLSECDVRSVEPLRYLKKLQTLNLKNNNNLTSVEPLSTNLTTLTSLDVTQTDQVYFTNNAGKYTLTVIKLNNSSVSITNADGTFNPSNQEKATAKALETLVLIDETKGTLSLPFEVEYDGTTYNICWISTNDNVIKFSYDYTSANNIMATTSYDIFETDNKSITLGIRLFNKDKGEAETSYIEKTFDVSFLTSQSVSKVTVQITQNGEYEDLSKYVPDPTLRKLLAETFANGDNQISYEELNAGNALDLSNTNVNDLTGLNYFQGITSLNLQNTELNVDENGKIDLSIISGIIIDESGNISSPNVPLKNITELYLSGADYDYKKIVYYYDTNNIYGLSSLNNVYVYGSKNLNEDDTLTDLYRVYLGIKYGKSDKFSCNVYKDSMTTAWDPYTKLCDIYKTFTPSIYTISEMGDNISFFATQTYKTGENIDDYLANYVVKSSNSYKYEFDFYGFKYQFGIQSKSLEASTGTKIWTSNYTDYFNTSGSVLSIKKYYPMDTFFYMRYTLEGKDPVNDMICMPYSYSTIEFMFNTNLQVQFEDGTTKSVNEVFPGRTIREKVLSKWSTGSNVMSITDISNKVTDASLTINGIYDSYGEDPIAIRGLKYLKNIKELRCGRDADFGDGSELVNITKLYISYSYIDLSTIKIDLPKLTDIYYYNQNKGVNFYDYYALIDIPSNVLSYFNEDIQAEKQCNAYEYVKVLTTKYNEINNITTEEQKNIKEAIAAISTNSDIFYFAHFPNISTMDLRCCGIRDFTFLVAFCNSSNPVGTMRINRNNTNTNNCDNRNATTVPTANLVRLMYEYRGTNKKDYYIGTVLNDKDENTKFDPVDFFSEPTTNIIDYDLVAEYNEYSSSIYDLNVIINNDEKYVTNTTEEHQAGTYVYLPKYSYYYATYNSSNDEANAIPRQFEIIWTLVGLGNDTLYNKLFGTIDKDYGVEFKNSKTDSYTNPYQNIIINSTNFDVVPKEIDGIEMECYKVLLNDIGYDYYFYYKGVIGQTNPKGNTAKEFYYPILVLSKTSYYEGSVYDANKQEVISYANMHENNENEYLYKIKSDASYHFNATSNNVTGIYLSYRSISDTKLRLAMFMALSGMATNVAATTTYTYSLPGLMFVGVSNDTASTSNVNLEMLSVHNYVVGLDGSGHITITFKYYIEGTPDKNISITSKIIGAFADSTFFKWFINAHHQEIKNNYIYSVEFMKYRCNATNTLYIRPGHSITTKGASLGWNEEFVFDNNIIRDVSPFAYVKNGYSLSITDNAIDTLIADNGKSKFLDGSETTNTRVYSLKLSGNQRINEDDIKSLSCLTNLNELIIAQTNAAYGMTNSIIEGTNSTGLIWSLYAIVSATNKDLRVGTDSWNTATINKTNISNMLNTLNTDSTIKALLSAEGYKTSANASFSLNINDFSFEFMDEKIYSGKFTNLSYGIISTTFRITWNNIYITIPVNVNLGSNNTILIIVNSANESQYVHYTVADLDPALFAYFNASANVLSSNQYGVTSNYNNYRSYKLGTTLTIGDQYYFASKPNFNIYTLKGLDKLSWITNLQINGFGIENIGWTNKFNNVTSLSIQFSTLTEANIVEILKYTPNITSLNLFNMVLDYDKDNLGTTINSLSKLNTVQINNLYHFYNRYSTNIVENTLAFYNNSNYVFGSSGMTIGQLTQSDSDKLLTYKKSYDGGSNYIYFYNTENSSARFNYANAYLKYAIINGKNITVDGTTFNPIDSKVLNSYTYSSGYSIFAGEKTNEKSQLNYVNIQINDLLINNSWNDGTVKNKLLDPNDTTKNTMSFYSSIANEGDGYQIYLPTSFMYANSLFNVSWKLSNDTTNIPSGFVFVDENGLISLKKDDNFKKLGTSGTKNFNLSATVTCGTISIVKTYKINIYLSALRPSDVDETLIHDSQYYIELERNSVSADITPYCDSENDDEYAIYRASDIFNSTTLIQTMYDKVQNSGMHWALNTKLTGESGRGTKSIPKLSTHEILGIKYYSYEAVQSVRSISFGLNDGIENQSNNGITSIEGVQYFTNCEEIIFPEGHIMDYSPISNLKLKRAYFNLASNEYDSARMDMSCLNNSIDTLEQIKYVGGGGAKANPIDFSYFLRFRALTWLKIYSSDDTTNYKNSSIFKYFVANVVNDFLGNKEIYPNLKYFSIDSKEIIKNSSITMSNAYALITVDDLFAAKVLNAFATELTEPITFKYDTTYVYNSELQLDGSKTSYELPSYIYYEGEKYYINWQSGSKYLNLTWTSKGENNQFDYETDGTYVLTTDTDCVNNHYSLVYHYLVAKVMVNGKVYDRMILLQNQFTH